MKSKKGFTILELSLVVIAVSFGLVLFFIQKSNMEAMRRDEDRKTAINAMYYALEEGYYKDHKYYPETISESVLKVMDPALFTDPNGINLGQEGSTYSYTAANCEDGKCREYTLRAILEKEDVYIKKNRN